MAEYHNQSKLRFWCQMVLPLVYDDSLSYMELLNKVVSYLNNCIQDVGNCETNIESLLEAFVNLQDYVNEIAEDITPIIEEKIDEIIESGEFGEILADALATVVAPEYDSSESYVPLNYAIYDGALYCCTGNTTGEWDSTKWRETTVGDELNTLMQKVYSLNAGDVSFNASTNYPSGTVGNKLKSLTANDIEYNSSETYNDATVGKELRNLNGAITSLGSDDIANDSTNVSGLKVTNALDTLNDAINAITPLDTAPTQNSTKGITSGAVYKKTTEQVIYQDSGSYTNNIGVDLDLTENITGHSLLKVVTFLNSVASNTRVVLLYPIGGGACYLPAPVDANYNYVRCEAHDKIFSIISSSYATLYVRSISLIL